MKEHFIQIDEKTRYVIRGGVGNYVLAKESFYTPRPTGLNLNPEPGWYSSTILQGGKVKYCHKASEVLKLIMEDGTVFTSDLDDLIKAEKTLLESFNQLSEKIDNMK
jgi:hypothetical protein